MMRERERSPNLKRNSYTTGSTKSVELKNNARIRYAIQDRLENSTTVLRVRYDSFRLSHEILFDTTASFESIRYDNPGRIPMTKPTPSVAITYYRTQIGSRNCHQNIVTIRRYVLAGLATIARVHTNIALPARAPFIQSGYFSRVVFEKLPDQRNRQFTVRQLAI